MRRFRLALIVAIYVAVVSHLTPVGAQPPAGPPPAPPAPPAPVPAAPPATSADEKAGLLAETVGLLASLQLYQSYLNIGLLADAKAEGVYDAAIAAPLLGSVVTPLAKVEAQLTKLAALPLPVDDAAALAKLLKITKLVRTQGTELEAFWQTGVMDHARRYEAARREAWRELNALLKLEDTTTDEIPAPRAVAPKQ